MYEQCKVPPKNDVIQYKVPIIGQYKLLLTITNAKMYTGLSYWSLVFSFLAGTFRCFTIAASRTEFCGLP